MNWLVRIILALWIASAVGCSSLPSTTSSFKSMKSVFTSPPPDREAAQAHFRKGDELFQKASKLEGKQRAETFLAAVSPYSKAAQRSPDTPLEEDALMMVGESLFFADEYTKATEAYDALTVKYQSTRHMTQVDKRRFAIAQYWIDLAKSDDASWLPSTSGRRPMMDTFGHAVKTFDKIRFDDPTGKLADDATMAAAVANFEKRKFGAADILLDDIRENFPKSEHQFDAHFLGLKAKLEMYEGPDYSGVALDEAEQLVKRMVRLFPRESREHREYLENAFKDIRLKKANREFSMAKFYDNRKEYGAAKLYYSRVGQQYGDTNLAIEAENRLAVISDLPPSPPDRLAPIAELFPKDEGIARPLLKKETVSLR